MNGAESVPYARANIIVANGVRSLRIVQTERDGARSLRKNKHFRWEGVPAVPNPDSDRAVDTYSFQTPNT